MQQGDIFTPKVSDSPAQRCHEPWPSSCEKCLRSEFSGKCEQRGQDENRPRRLFCPFAYEMRKMQKGVAERVGFEPTVLVKVHTLSKRAP